MRPEASGRTPARIWVVEDNALFRETLEALVNGSERMECARAFPTAEDALEALRSEPLPDLILMDLALPGMGGIEAIARCRDLASSVPVVVLTVDQSGDRIFEAICAGASGYLLKSSPGDDLVEALSRVLRGGAAMDARIARRVLEMFRGLTNPKADYGLTAREHEILQLLVDGMTKKQIAEHLRLSPHTIDGHVRNIYMKLHVQNRSGAVAKALRENLLPPKRPAG